MNAVRRRLVPFGLGMIAALALCSAPRAEEPAVRLGPWYTTGHLPAQSFSEGLFPEQGVDLDAKDAAGRRRWQKGPQWPDGQCHNLDQGSRGPTYLYRVLTAAKAVRLTASLGSDDGLAVWLNGRQIHVNDVPRGISPDQDQVTLDLQPGENQLLLKIFNNSGGHGFYFALQGKAISWLRQVAQDERGLPIDAGSVRLAVEDLIQTFGSRYPRGTQYLEELDAIERQIDAVRPAYQQGDAAGVQQFKSLLDRLVALQQQALLDNPLMAFDQLLVVRRSAGQLGLPSNWQGNCAVPRNGYENQIAVLSPVRPGGKLEALYTPEKGAFVGDVDLNFDGQRMLFSMPGGQHNRWQIWELRADGSGLRQVTPGEEPDVDNYDPCYLPDGRILFCSTRCFQGVPCVGGGNTVANLCLMNADGTDCRQLGFDQDHNWCPTVLHSGRVLYTRWEYSDTPHYFTRLLFHMNPDGTAQMEYYGSNSYWPNSIFYARPIPGHPTKVIAVIGGHHDHPRMGDLAILDPASGRFEADGALQRISHYGKKVQPLIVDGLTYSNWPKYLHPWPLSDKHFLVACQPTAQSLWGIYLADAFDNLVLLKEEPGFVLFEPVPLKKTDRPPVVPDKVDLSCDDATVYLADVYQGPGLRGVPRGTVKKLRIYELHYAYPGMGGHINIGIDGPWDGRRIHGTVPVEADGSASFKVPANTPLAVQPLDAEGKALQVMRSWFTAMPGETLSCVGCHEPQNSSPPTKANLAMRRPPSKIEPWYGPVRGFSFKREVQPVLDEYCVGCHDGQPQPGSQVALDLRLAGTASFRNFTPSYVALHPFVRRPGPESDYHLQKPLEYHADGSELVQMLNKGHHGVELDAEAWDRLITWIDLNVPDHGTWTEHCGVRDVYQRRLEMRTKYANRPEDPEAFDHSPPPPVAFVQPQESERTPQQVACPGWPFDASEAKRRQDAAGMPVELQLQVADAAMDFVLVPAGEFVMGDAAGPPDESPLARVKIDRPFYLGAFEVTNAQYAAFDAAHESAVISVYNKDQSARGERADRDGQPVIRVTWKQALAFCEWLSAESGLHCTLPTEAQWEYACRAGTSTPLSFGDCSVDFGALANLADQRVLNLLRGDSPRWIPAIEQVNDGAVVSDQVGRYPANAWGLYDMHGNVAEWTRSVYRTYPYDPGDGRDDPSAEGVRSVRGGSWHDRPQRARSGFRQAYQPWQGAFNVGFRVAIEAK